MRAFYHNHCMVPTLIYIKLTTYTLSEKISYFPFCPAATTVPRSGKRITNLVLLHYSPLAHWILYMKKKGCTYNSQAFSETGRVRETKYLQDMLVAPSTWCRGDAWLWHPESFVSFQGQNKNILAFSLDVTPAPQFHC